MATEERPPLDSPSAHLEHLGVAHEGVTSSEVRGQIESALNNLKDALKSEDGERIKKGIENVNQAAYKLGEEIYKNVGQRGGAGGAGGPTGGQAPRGDGATAGAAAGGAKKDEDVIDAEYEVKE